MAKDIELAILFADVVGSTKLYEVMGDLKARDTVAHCIEVMRQATEDNNGTVIKTMGDEVMSTFPTADDALNSARQMQQAITSNAALSGDGHPVAIRIGCHYGPVVLDNRDIFGSTVHTANRMTSQAKAAQILTTSLTVDQLSKDWQAVVRQIDVAPVRGKSGDMDVYEALWQTEDVTSMLPTIDLDSASERGAGRLILRCRGKEIVVDENNPSITLGRAEENDLIIKGNLISRVHARIEIKRNKIVVIDQSTNGTFVMTSAGEEQFVRRDSMNLKGDGMIGLGRAAEVDSQNVIKYSREV
jgi:class 3 adenylate cyclase